MLPHTRALMDALRDESAYVPELSPRGSVDRQPAGEPQVLQLQLKRKHAANMLKRMLSEAGYGDLAKYTNLKRESLEDYGDE